MRQGWKVVSLCAALALAPMAVPAVHAAGKAASKSSAETSTSRRALRQFTGVVTAVDKSGITVEKGGKKPRTLSFTRDAEMKTTGDLERGARVTVYYREDGGRVIAHRVVVKDEKNGSTR